MLESINDVNGYLAGNLAGLWHKRYRPKPSLSSNPETIGTHVCISF